jgi:hypothetical protein
MIIQFFSHTTNAGSYAGIYPDGKTIVTAVLAWPACYIGVAGMLQHYGSI